ncbi:hypothetical protein DSM3645_27126 [Blastopirellula marina DSM 3645]|uniref:Uncharacterized protein n=1 Tax=Blastopirellula marina DSM 3645 TaxID=314230 RepID=A3ZZX8_9BACT|nr:hypothetical protein DSM3645_27126 [Blastopirellula marina DSM 3645]
MTTCCRKILRQQLPPITACWGGGFKLVPFDPGVTSALKARPLAARALKVRHWVDFIADSSIASGVPSGQSTIGK